MPELCHYIKIVRGSEEEVKYSYANFISRFSTTRSLFAIFDSLKNKIITSPLKFNIYKHAHNMTVLKFYLPIRLSIESFFPEIFWYLKYLRT